MILRRPVLAALSPIHPNDMFSSDICSSGLSISDDTHSGLSVLSDKLLVRNYPGVHGYRYRGIKVICIDQNNFMACFLFASVRSVVYDAISMLHWWVFYCRPGVVSYPFFLTIPICPGNKNHYR